jgi:hypothetical protein
MIPRSGSYASGSLFDPGDRTVLVCPKGDFDHFVTALQGAVETSAELRAPRGQGISGVLSALVG